jgi:hypothetical protein
MQLNTRILNAGLILVPVAVILVSMPTLQKLDIATAITEKVARYAHWQADWSDGSGLLRNHKVTAD